MTGGDSDKGDHPAGVEQFRNLPVSRLNSKYLYSNQTSHAWVFGAIAELLDNAMDPDCLASQVMIQLTEVQEKAVLVIMDNGNGMTPEALYKMLSFGYSEKTQEVIQGRRSIGHYGNGFKSGSMRIGKDALVLTKCGDTQSVGLLSRTFLETIEAEEVYLPLLTWDHEGKLQNEDDKTVREGLEAISKYSIFDSEEDLLSEFEAIKETGTMIIISNLKKLGDENDADSPLELCVDPEEADIKISSYSPDGKSKFQQLRVGQGSNVDIPLDYSLRAYVSVLYKVPRMQIFLMGKKVKCKRASQQLSERMHDTYKPYSAGGQPADILIGFSEPEDLYGMMMYHNNRLIKPYVRVGCQMEANAKGVGVLGIIDANFLTPMHNKQDFADTKEYRGLINKLSQNLNMFWWAKVEKPAAEEKDREEQQKKKRRRKQPDVNWVQCGYPPCAKWRILPKGTDMTPFNDENFHWVCSMHPNPKIADSNHEYPEDTWDIDVVQGEEAAAKRREWQAEKRQKKAEEVAKKDAQVLQLAQEGLLQHIQFEGVNQPVNAGPEPPREVQVQQPSQPPTPGAPEPPREVQVQQPLASPDALECKNDSDSDTISEDHAAEIRQPPVTQKEGTAVRSSMQVSTQATAPSKGDRARSDTQAGVGASGTRQVDIESLGIGIIEDNLVRTRVRREDADNNAGGAERGSPQPGPQRQILSALPCQVSPALPAGAPLPNLFEEVLQIGVHHGRPVHQPWDQLTQDHRLALCQTKLRQCLQLIYLTAQRGGRLAHMPTLNLVSNSRDDELARINMRVYFRAIGLEDLYNQMFAHHT